MLSNCTVLSDSKETELRSSDEKASPSAGKNTGIVLVPCRAWKCVSTAISGGVDIPEIAGYNLLRHRFLVRATTITSRSVSHELET